MQTITVKLKPPDKLDFQDLLNNSMFTVSLLLLGAVAIRQGTGKANADSFCLYHHVQ